jgi:hypothetical protein
VVEVTHSKVSIVADDPDTGQVRPSDWNAAHAIDWEGSEPRERLAANTTLYLRANLGTCTMSVASPAEVTLNSHGLQAGDPVVFNLPFDCPHDAVGHATLTIASPGVFTVGTSGAYTTHGYANNDPIAIRTTGALPTGLTASVGNTITKYYVRNRTDTTFEVSATSGGSSINTSGTQSGKHKPERASHLPTGVTEGQVYYVISAGLSTNTFRFSATPGGGAVNTSGTTAGKITVSTGNDSNDGTAATRTGALLHPRRCVRVAQSYDFDGKMLTFMVADGTYRPDPAESTENNRDAAVLSILFPVPDNTPIADDAWPTGGGRLKFHGNEDHRNNVLFYAPEGPPIYLIGPLPWNVHFRSIALKTDTGGQHLFLEGVEYPGLYLDHLAYRGTLDWSIFNFGCHIAMHGMHEVLCAPGFMFAWSSAHSYLEYSDSGLSYFPGMIFYEPQSYVDAMWMGQGVECQTVIVLAVRFEGSNSGPSMKAESGAYIGHVMHSSFNNDPIPGTAPTHRLGGIINVRVLSTAGLNTWAEVNGDRVRLSADVDKTNNTLADVTEFKFPCAQAGLKYEVEATLFTTSDVAAGVKFALAGDATLANVLLEAEVTDGTSIALRERHTVQGTAFGDITAVTAATVKIRGSFTVTTRGFATLQFAQNVTNATESTLLAGSTMAVVPVL